MILEYLEAYTNCVLCVTGYQLALLSLPDVQTLLVMASHPGQAMTALSFET